MSWRLRIAGRRWPSASSLMLVVLQILFSATVLLTHGLVRPRMEGVLLSALGVVLGLWAMIAMKPRHVRILPDVADKSRLVTSGPYRWIRHPMYTGLLLLCLGAFVSRPSAWRLALWACLAVTLGVKARYEERLLALAFPEYPAYRAETWQFLPYLL